MQEFWGFVVICIQTLIFFFHIEVDLEAASSFKMSETFSTFARYHNPGRKDVHVVKKQYQIFYVIHNMCVLTSIY
jgi:hypothetical protein